MTGDGLPLCVGRAAVAGPAAGEPHIRLAVPGDGPLLTAIEQSAGERFRSIPDIAWVADGDSRPPERYQALIAAGATWVALDGNGAAVGFLCGEPVGDALHIWELGVVLERQNQGFGRALIAHAMDYARANGLPSVTLTTFRAVPWNEPAYRRAGFVTLSDEDLDPRLAALLDAEDAAGLARATRCAMRRALA